MRRSLTVACLLCALTACARTNSPDSGQPAHQASCATSRADPSPVVLCASGASHSTTNVREWRTLQSPVKPEDSLHDVMWLEIRGSTDLDIRTVVKYCTSLKGLRLTERVSGWDNVITDEGLGAMADLSGLVALEIGGAARITDEGMKCLRCLPDLATLVLTGCPRLTGACLHYLASPAKLLDFAASGWRKGLSIDELLTVVSHFQIRSLRLLGSMFRGHEDELSSIFEYTPSLIDLVLNGCRAVTDSVMSRIATGAPFIKQLGVAATSISDVGLSHVTKLSHLHTLNISNCSKLSGSGIQQLRSAMPHVQV